MMLRRVGGSHGGSHGGSEPTVRRRLAFGKGVREIVLAGEAVPVAVGSRVVEGIFLMVDRSRRGRVVDVLVV